MIIDELGWLQSWYHSYCDEEWKPAFGVSISTLDNPGWLVKVDLAGTSLEGTQLEYQLTDHGDNDWYGYSIENNVFQGCGDAFKLSVIINVFRQLVYKKDNSTA